MHAKYQFYFRVNKYWSRKAHGKTNSRWFRGVSRYIAFESFVLCIQSVYASGGRLFFPLRLFVTQNKRGGRAPQAPPLDPPLYTLMVERLSMTLAADGKRQR